MSFAGRIREFRRQKGLTQQDFAALIDVSIGTIGNWEKDRSTPIDDALASIARKMGVCETWLRSGEGDMYCDGVGKVLQRNDTLSYKAPEIREPYIASGQQRMQPTSPSQRDDMHLPPEWLAPIVAGADAVLFDRSSFEHAAEAKMKGRRYRLRVELEADDAEPKQTDPLPPKE